jgi:hypothetical protein
MLLIYSSTGIPVMPEKVSIQRRLERHVAVLVWALEQHA